MQYLSTYSKFYYKSIYLIGDNKKFKIPPIYIFNTKNNFSQLPYLIIAKELSTTSAILENKIKKELYKIKYNPNHIGFKYLLEAITLCYQNNNIYNINLNKNIYPLIAQKYNKSINNIKCNISQATSSMYNSLSVQEKHKYLNIKPHVKDIIISVLDKLLF